MKKDVKIVRDPKAIKVGIEDTRNNILSLLRVNDMTISQLADSLNKDQSTIYRHIKKLEEFGYVEVAGEKKEHHIPEKVYGRTASVFLLNPRSPDSEKSPDMKIEWEKGHAERLIELLEMIGYESEDPENTIDDISDLFIEMKNRVIEPLKKSEESLEDVSFPFLMRLELFLFLLKEREEGELKERVDGIFDKFNKK